jgi:YHS domain-containing protein
VKEKILKAAEKFGGSKMKSKSLIFSLIAIVVLACGFGIRYYVRKPVVVEDSQQKAIELVTKYGVPPAEKHEHKTGKFGGFMTELGRDNYHLEAVMKKDVIEIYTLGKDESKLIVVDKQMIEAYIRGKSIDVEDQVNLMPKPQQGDGEGTSRFEGKIPIRYLGEEEIILSFNIVIKGERFRARIVIILNNRQTDLSKTDERKLYLTPGGKYTEKDIVMNGGMTASEKFKNFVSQHDFKPKKGDKICPITLTKANPKCTWIIGGKEYWFCCPPCIEEFLRLAKEKPDEIKGPEEYVKQ